MRGMGSKYDYDALSYQPDESKRADTYFVETPCRAVLHAQTFESSRAPAPAVAAVVAKPATSLRSMAKGLLKR